MEVNMKKSKSKSAARLLCIAIVLALISCVGASLLQTSFGQVSVTDFSIPTDDGKWLGGKLYRPANASGENKVPLVITCHGYLNNNEMQDSIAIELSRRGIAVIAMDAYFHGNSSSSNVPVVESCMTETTGMIPLVEYAYNNLNYIDKSRIGIMGHSMGGMNVWFTLAYYGAQYNAAIELAKAPDSDGGEEVTEAEQAAADAINKVNAGLASGNVRLSTEDMFKNIHANMAINYSRFDEGCYDLTRGNGDLSGDCYESLSAVSSALPQEDQVSSVEIGRFYGSPEDRTLRVVYNPSNTHQLQHFSVECTADNIEFFTTAFGVDSSLEKGNQIWLLKELFNALGLIACMMAIVPIALLLLELPVFASLKGETPPPLPALNTRSRKLRFWGGWILSWLISWLSFMPISTLDTVIFPSTAAMGFGKWFPQQCNNSVMLWAVFNGLVGLVLFWLSWRIGKKDGVESNMLGLRISARAFLKTLALAIFVFLGFYAFLFFAEYFFNTDFRLWFVAVCDFSADKLLVALRYIPLFFIFFAANAMTTNGINRVAGQKEWLNLLLCALGNVLGIVLVNAQQYIQLFSTGNALFGPTRLYPMVALPLIPLLFIAAYINRALFKATGKVWLGAIVNCLIIVMISVANTATLLPL